MIYNNTNKLSIIYNVNTLIGTSFGQNLGLFWIVYDPDRIALLDLISS